MVLWRLEATHLSMQPLALQPADAAARPTALAATRPELASAATQVTALDSVFLDASLESV